MRRIAVRAVLSALCLIATLAAVPPAPAAEKPTAPPSASAAASSGPIDINRAGEVELASLPGIGEVVAKRIVEFRKEHGPFQRVEDLMKVKGIGEKSFEKLRPAITVGRAEGR